MRRIDNSRIVSEARWGHKGYEVSYDREVVSGNWNAPKYRIIRPGEDEWSFASARTLDEAREVIEADLAAVCPRAYYGLAAVARVPTRLRRQSWLSGGR